MPREGFFEEVMFAQNPKREDGPSQGVVCGERYEWNEGRIEYEEIDIISVVVGREKGHGSPEMECSGRRKKVQCLEHSKREEWYKGSSASRRELNLLFLVG